MKILRLITTIVFVLFVVTINAQTVLMGDVDGDGELTTNDVDELRKCILLPDYQLKKSELADMNSDGVVDIVDVSLLIHTLLHPLRGYDNGYEFVDLGLSVRWATCNIGATKPESYGSYFAWGETTSKSSGYSWSTYTLCGGTEKSLTKYCNNSSYGNNDGLTTLTKADDAAYVNWGSNWRMPTEAEMTELRTKCTWTWTRVNNVNGYKVSASNGNYIFLPAAGFNSNYSPNNAGNYGYYWTSSLNASDCRTASEIYINSNRFNTYNNERCDGQSIRPVLP